MPDFLTEISSQTEINFLGSLTTVITAFALGILVSLTYMKTYSKGQHSKNFMLALVMVPSIIAIIILLVGSNIARAFSLAGAFSIIRFRSTPGDPKDIAYVFFAMAAGLACGTGLLSYAIMFTILLCLFMVILCKINFGNNNESLKILKIVIPEDLDYHGIFDDIFDRYTTNIELITVKTTNLGTLYELVYEIVIKDSSNEKKFIDALRCRNGNLNISLSMKPETKDKF
ncbi:MAG: DUF4956 domain-containing protein [Clostridiales bacterium]